MDKIRKSLADLFDSQDSDTVNEIFTRHFCGNDPTKYARVVLYNRHDALGGLVDIMDEEGNVRESVEFKITASV
jgi:hypothetical protein